MCEHGETVIFIPSIVLAKALSIFDKKRVSFEVLMPWSVGLGGGEFPRQIIVDDVDAELIRASFGIAEFVAEISD